MRETINRDKAGTTEYQATAHYRVPLTNPHDLGNRGLEGFDEESETRTFPTRQAAQEWALAWRPDEGTSDYWQVDQLEWEPDEYEDATYGTILDAVDTVVVSWFFNVATQAWEEL